MKYSVIVPVYRNQSSIGDLLTTLVLINQKLNHQLEVVFVVDGSPDDSGLLLQQALPNLDFAAQVLLHARNFGAFAAIRTGLAAARGEFFAVMAADLQEPPELLLTFFQVLENQECDVALGTRIGREDPWPSRLLAQLFWYGYRQLVVPQMPAGGVDIFGINQLFRQQLLQLQESRSSLIAQIFWLGFRRQLIPYRRLARFHGKSSWTFRKKFDYMLDSIFAFTDLPIRLLLRIGFFGLLFSLGLGIAVVAAKITGAIPIPGYAATILTMLLLGTLNLLGLGLVGTYAWRGYENSKARPLAVVARTFQNNR